MTTSNEKHFKQNKYIVPTAQLPSVFRLVHLSKVMTSGNCNIFNAKLYNESASIAVTWISDCDDKLQVGQLVYPDWMSQQISLEGCNIVQKLTTLKNPESGMNVFDTVPKNWVKDRRLINQARNIFASLSPEFALFANNIFWEHQRFYKFLVVPHSTKKKNHFHGNLRETIRLTMTVSSLIIPNSKIDSNIATLAAWLNDAENADQFTFNSNTKRFELIDNKDLESNANKIIQWMNATAQSYAFNMKESDYLKLTSALIICRMPIITIRLSWSVSPEAKVIAVATKLLNHIDLENKTFSEVI